MHQLLGKPTLLWKHLILLMANPETRREIRLENCSLSEFPHPKMYILLRHDAGTMGVEGKGLWTREKGQSTGAGPSQYVE